MQNAWAKVSELLATHDDHRTFQARLAKALDETPALHQLVFWAYDSHSFLEILVALAGAELGNGWSTNGMLGGTGCNVYLATDDKLVAVALHYFLFWRIQIGETRDPQAASS